MNGTILAIGTVSASLVWASAATGQVLPANATSRHMSRSAVVVQTSIAKSPRVGLMLSGIVDYSVRAALAKPATADSPATIYVPDWYWHLGFAPGVVYNAQNNHQWEPSIAAEAGLVYRPQAKTLTGYGLVLRGQNRPGGFGPMARVDIMDIAAVEAGWSTVPHRPSGTPVLVIEFSKALIELIGISIFRN